MKKEKEKKLFFCLLVLFLVLSPVFAIEIKSKDSFSKGETFLAEVSGNILQDIKAESVGFYKLGHVLLPLEYDIGKINNSFYIYAILPYAEQNYTLRIKDVNFKENNLVQTQTIEKNFTAGNSTADFSVKPGFIISNKDFIIKVHNNLNNEITINYDLAEVLGSFSVPAQSDKEEKILIVDIDSTKVVKMKVSSSGISYEIPSYIIKNFTYQNNTNNETNNTNNLNNQTNNQTLNEIVLLPKISFSVKNLSATLNKNQFFSSIQLFGQINLSNLGENETGIVNLTISDSLKDYINISRTTNSINVNQSSSLTFTIIFKNTGTFVGYIAASCLNSSDKLNLNFKVGENVTINSSNSPALQNVKTCSELSGKKCQTNEICVGRPTAASDTFTCCIGQCNTMEEINAPPTRNWTVIVILLVILAGIGAFLFFKYKKPTASKNILSSKTESYEKSHETTGKITRV